jgi:hypothetical protein
MYWVTFWAIFFTNSSGNPGEEAANVNTEQITKVSFWRCFQPGLPDGSFSNPKIPIWVILEGPLKIRKW